MLWTNLRTKEYPPEELASFEKNNTLESSDDTPENKREINYYKNAIYWAFGGALFTWSVHMNGLEKELYLIGIGALIFSVTQLMLGYMIKSGIYNSGLVEVIEDLFHMPKTMAQLAIVQFFTWFALFSMWIYTTSAVTSHIYGNTETSSQAYNDGADWV